MKKAEYESLIKSFSLFFIALAMIGAIVAVIEYHKQLHEMDDDLFNRLKVCSLELECADVRIDFVPMGSAPMVQLLHSPRGPYALFPIPNAQRYALKLQLPSPLYTAKIDRIRAQIFFYYGISLLLLIPISLIFALYSLSPLRRSLHLIEEFSRDIIHDFHTPLASLKLDISRLSFAAHETKKQRRLLQSLETLETLNENLRYYLEDRPHYPSIKVDLAPLIHQRCELFALLYPSLHFDLSDESFEIEVPIDGMNRLLDNLLSNACKHNHPQGSVQVRIVGEDSTLRVYNTGPPIRHAERVFRRWYTEHPQGVGIGLHIVAKLCEDMNLQLELQSDEAGTCFILLMASVRLF